MKAITGRRQYVLERVVQEDRGHSSPCWIWQRHLIRQGYGRCTLQGRMILAHRLSYEAWKGEIPPGLAIDHLCRVRVCCNPEHLEAVTTAVNNQRAQPFRRPKTHCHKGHAYAEVGRTSKGACLECDRQARKRFKENHPGYLRKWKEAQRLADGIVPMRLRTRCPQGHEFTPANTRRDTQNGRHCRICDRDATARYKAKERASA